MRLDEQDRSGYGEVAPASRVTGESLADAKRWLESLAAPEGPLEAALAASEFTPGTMSTPAAECGLTVARLDLEGRRRGLSLRHLLNLPQGEIASSITVSLGSPADVLEEAALRDAEGWTIFKIKVGGTRDEETLRALRDRYPDKRIRVDANEAWSPALAAARLALLERLDVEFVEQPLARGEWEASADLARRFDIPIVLDESLQSLDDALELVRRGAGDGANVKLAKCGGPFAARRIIKFLRDAGWKVMMGCMIESRIGIAAAAAFAGAIDYADLDGHALLAEDPFSGFELPQGRVSTPDQPGLGVDVPPGWSGGPRLL